MSLMNHSLRTLVSNALPQTRSAMGDASSSVTSSMYLKMSLKGNLTTSMP